VPSRSTTGRIRIRSSTMTSSSCCGTASGHSDPMTGRRHRRERVELISRLAVCPSALGHGVSSTSAANAQCARSTNPGPAGSTDHDSAPSRRMPRFARTAGSQSPTGRASRDRGPNSPPQVASLIAGCLFFFSTNASPSLAQPRSASTRIAGRRIGSLLRVTAWGLVSRR
jgi:hypothetical protein